MKKKSKALGLRKLWATEKQTENKKCLASVSKIY